jgi:anion-transporting  ArsA/GET3 family ATPase
VVNRVLPKQTSDPYFMARRQQEQIYLNDIETRFARRATVYVPQFESDVYGMAALQRLSHLLVQ